MDKFDEWVTLKEEMQKCHGCNLSSGDRVLDCGNRNARIMIVGDKPSRIDGSDGEVFDSITAEYIESTLKLFDIDPASVYMTNLINCIPPPYYRLRLNDVDKCLNCLRKQFRLVSPEIVLCLGTISCKKLIDNNFNLSENHGKPINKGKVMFMGTFHPSTFHYNTANRDAFLGDIASLYKFCKVYPAYSK